MANLILSRVGGWWVGEIKIKDHLSPAEVEIGLSLAKHPYLIRKDYSDFQNGEAGNQHNICINYTCIEYCSPHRKNFSIL